MKKLPFNTWKRKHTATLKELHAEFLSDTTIPNPTQWLLTNKEVLSFDDFCRGLFSETIHAEARP